MLFNRRQITDDGDVVIAPSTSGTVPGAGATLCALELHGHDRTERGHPVKYLDRDDVERLVDTLLEALGIEGDVARIRDLGGRYAEALEAAASAGAHHGRMLRP